MKNCTKIIVYLSVVILAFSCKNVTKKESNIKTVKEKSSVSAKDILGNPNFLAISYGGYRHVDHDIEPTLDDLKEDMLLLSAMGIKIVRTYKVHLPQASNLLKAITELKKENPNFEMYVMLGAWIDCKNARTEKADHNVESEANTPQIAKAVTLANQYPDIVKIIAVGNEAMVKWAESYYVQPAVILKWVSYLQDLKKSGKLNKDLWITSSDNFASWGGGDTEYHVKDLEAIKGEIRPGIVHRIDKETSGLLVVAKNAKALEDLSDQLRLKTVTRKYVALVDGVIPHNLGKVNAPIGRDPKNRQKMKCVDSGKQAVTNFKVLSRYEDYTLVECVLETGRTHQIRVHMAYINHPVVGDPKYGRRKTDTSHGQFLHAKTLGFIHPTTKEYMEFNAELPEYFKQHLETLE